MRLVVEPQAQADIDNTVSWYDSQDFGVGSAFLSELKSLLKRIADKPKRNPFYKPGLRRAKTKSFPYTVFYSQRDETVFIHAVMHHRRDLGALDERLN